MPKLLKFLLFVLFLCVSFGPTAADDVLWTGQLHLGDTANAADSPYGQTFKGTAYAGLSIEFPLTLTAISDINQDTCTTTFEIEADHVQIFAGPGHKISIISYQKDPSGAWKRMLLTNTYLKTSLATISILLKADIKYLAIKIDIDETPGPSLFNDIIMKRIMMKSAKYKGVIGFY